VLGTNDRLLACGEDLDDQRVARAYSRGHLVVDVLPEYRRRFQGLIEETMNLSALDSS